MESLNIIHLIEKNAMTRLSKEYENKLVNKIKYNFSDNQQQLFVASFYTFLNYDAKKDFVIDFDNVWKWLGYTRKSDGKRVLEKFFVINVDYKLATETSVASFDTSNKSHGGQNKETILLNVNTFKKFCLKAGTKKADEVHDYYIKLEELLQETINEETNELRKQLENKEKEKKDLEEDLKLKDKDLKFKKYLLDKSEIEKKQLEVRLEKKERVKYEHTNSVYIISNPTIKPVIYGKSSNNNSTDSNSNNNTTDKKRKKKKKYFKLGKSSDRNNRLSNYCAGAPLDYIIEHSRPLCSKREESVIENLLLIIFDSYRVVNEIGSKREWVENIELDVLKNEMDLLVDFLETRKQFHDSKYVPLSKEVLSKKNNHIENKKLDESDYEEDDDFEEEKYDDDEKGDDYVEENYENKKGDDDFVEENYDDEKENYQNKKGDDFVEENDNVEEENDDVEEENDIVEKEVILDPRNFDKFIADYCEVGENFFEPKSDLRSAHRVWSNCTFKDVKKDFENYLIKNFKSGAQFIDNSRRNVYRGLRLKKITFTPSKNNYDYEQFIAQRCKVEHQNRIGYADFYKYFEEYKKETDPKYKLTGTYKAEIKKYLQSKFNAGRVYVSKPNKSGGLRGVYGIGHAKNNFGLKELKRKNKQVGQFDSKTNKLLNTYDSMILGSKTLNIPFSSFSHYIHSQAIYDGKIYKFI
uniref:MSV199 domain-containing protein n=1 Tax=viral metagenome TaxID=1070528 RepID=A0A6C0E090_9ZZZZ